MRRKSKFNRARSKPEKKLYKQQIKVAETTDRIIQNLKSRVEEMEDLEAIRQLKAAYCDACDDDHNGEAVSSLFSKSGTWQQISATSHADSHKHVGRKEIATFMCGLRDAGFIVCSSHVVTNPVLKISGNSASGDWKFLMLYTHKDGSRHKIIGRYQDTYVKVKGQWYFESLTAIVEDNKIYLTGNKNE